MRQTSLISGDGGEIRSDLVMQPLEGMREQVPVLVDRACTGTPSQTKAMALSSPGVTFTDGIEVIAKPTDRQPKTAAA